MAVSLGTIEKFHHEGQDWIIYHERLEQFFEVNEIKDSETSKKQCAVLINQMSADTYALVRDLCFPRKPKEKTYSELCEIMRQHFSPRVAIYRERAEFYRAFQKLGEPITEWHARIKNLAVNCKFEQLDKVLRDKFVTGLLEGPIMDKLWEQDYKETATLNEMVQLALTKEAALEAGNKARRNSTATAVNVNWNQNAKSGRSGKPGQRKENRQPRSGNTTSCSSCGKIHQDHQVCKFKSAKCYKCKQIGHLASVCRIMVQQSNHYVETTSEDNLPLFMIRTSKSKPFTANVKVDNVVLDMEIDSGAGVSIISKELFLNKFVNHQLQESDIMLQEYTGKTTKPLGYFTVQVEYKNETKPINLHVVEGGGPPLLGRDWLNTFNLGIEKLGNKAGLNKISEISLKGTLKELESLFDGALGTYKFGKIHLELKPESKPVFCKPRSIPIAYKEKVEQELDRLIKENIITPIESSSWGTPLVPVLKQDGSIRLCADYKTTVNKFLVEVKYPLPRVEEIFAALQGGKRFSKIDLSMAYAQFQLDDISAKIVAWSTHKGIFQVNRLPFGVSPASAIFQRKLEQLLQGIPGVANFLDDIIVTGCDTNQHLGNLAAVFKRLLEAGLRVRLDKCDFFKTEVVYLGHIISREGIRKSTDKVKAILEAPEPGNTTQIKAFAGMVNYYGKFVPGLAQLMKPCYDLLKKDAKFVWNSECKTAFELVKKQIASDKVLVHFNPELPILLTSDASLNGIGAALSHRFPDGTERPVGFVSRTYSPAEKNYSVIDREALALYFAVKKFQNYLLGQKFILRTDHRPLLALFGENKGIPQMAASRLQRWAVYVSGFNYKIEYIKGQENVIADSFSRLPLPNPIDQDSDGFSYLNFIESQETPINSQKIKAESEKDPLISKIIAYVNKGWPNSVTEVELKPYFHRRQELTVIQGCVMWGYRVVIPKSLRIDLLKELHVSHQGIVRMKAVARSYMWWHKMDDEIEKISKACLACLEHRADPPKTALIPWEKPSRVGERIHIDFLDIQNRVYLIVLDSYSKWVDVHNMKGNTRSLDTINKLRNTFTSLGIPELIVSDNGTQLTSRQFREFLTKNGIKHITTPTFYPATNGAAENAVKTFKKALKSAFSDAVNQNVDTETIICRFLLNYRSTPHSTTGVTPSKLFQGRELRTRLDLIKPVIKIKNSTMDRTERIEHKNSGGRRKGEFCVGDNVMVRDYRTVNKKTWTPATIESRLGKITYLCKVNDSNSSWKRHLNQIIGYESKNLNKEQVSGVNSAPKFAGHRIGITDLNNSVETEEQVAVFELPEQPGLSTEGTASNVIRRSERLRAAPDRFGNNVAITK